MPTVPLNTITGPSGARLPNVGFAKPNMAEAQGSVAHALSSAASTAGRSADIMGQAIRSEAQRSDLLMQTEAAKASGRASMFAGIGDLGNTMMKGGAEYQRLSELRAAREAQSLLSQFRMDMSRTMYGAQDPATGQRIPGTLETPFAPTTEGENEPQGATIATSKAMRGWHENPNGAFQKASPRVKELFRQYAAEPTEDFMRQSVKQDAENYQRWKAQQDQMAESASLNNLNLQAASGDQEVWNMAAQRDAGAWAMAQMESYQSDPTNRDPAKAKWRGDPEQSAEMAAYFRTGFLQKANLQRIETLTASAMAEPDKARREQFLEMAAEAAEWKPEGAKDPILPPDTAAKAKLAIQNARQAANVASVSSAKIAMEKFWESMTPENSDAANKALENIPTQPERDALKATFLKEMAGVEIGLFRNIYAQHLLDPSKVSSDQVQMHLKGMKSPEAQIEAMDIIQKRTVGGTVGASANGTEKSRMAFAVAMNGYMYRDDKGNAAVRFEDRQNLRKINIEKFRNGEYAPDDWLKFHTDINKMTPDDQTLINQTVQAIERTVGKDIVDGAIIMQDGRLAQARYTADDKKNKIKKGEPMDSLEIEYFDQDYKTPDGKTDRATTDWINNGIQLDSEAVLALVDYVVKYQKANVMPDAKGKTLTIDQIVRQALRPENMPVAVDKARNFHLEANTEKWMKELQQLEATYMQQAFEGIDLQSAVP